jgi:hypothetical protein
MTCLGSGSVRNHTIHIVVPLAESFIACCTAQLHACCVDQPSHDSCKNTGSLHPSNNPCTTMALVRNTYPHRGPHSWSHRGGPSTRSFTGLPRRKQAVTVPHVFLAMSLKLQKNTIAEQQDYQDPAGVSGPDPLLAVLSCVQHNFISVGNACLFRLVLKRP